MFCSKCGNEVRDGAMFCSKCGNPVKQIRREVQQPVVASTAPVVGGNQPRTLCGVLKKQCKDYVFMIATLLLSIGQIILAISLVRMLVEYFTSEAFEELMEITEELPGNLRAIFVYMLIGILISYVAMILVVISGIGLMLAMYRLFFDAGSYGEHFRTNGFTNAKNSLRVLGLSVVGVVLFLIIDIALLIAFVAEAYNLESIFSEETTGEWMKIIFYIALYLGLAITFCVFMYRNANRLELYSNITANEKITLYVKDYKLPMINIICGIGMIVAVVCFSHVTEEAGVLSNVISELNGASIVAYVLNGLATLAYGFKIYSIDAEMERVIAQENLQ